MQRERLLAGVLEAAAGKGYPALTVADITAVAAVSRRTFYEHFRDKEDCFMAAIDNGAQELITEMLSAVSPADDWLNTVRASVLAYLRGFVARPHLAQAFNIEILAAGSRGLAFRAEIHTRFAEFYRDIYAQARQAQPGIVAIPDVAFRLATGAFDEFLVEWVRQGKVDDLEDLAPLATFVADAMRHGGPAATLQLTAHSLTLGVDTLPS